MSVVTLRVSVGSLHSKWNIFNHCYHSPAFHGIGELKALFNTSLNIFRLMIPGSLSLAPAPGWGILDSSPKSHLVAHLGTSGVLLVMQPCQTIWNFGRLYDNWRLPWNSGAGYGILPSHLPLFFSSVPSLQIFPCLFLNFWCSVDANICPLSWKPHCSFEDTTFSPRAQ